MACYLVHGDIHVTIFEAEGLVNEDRKSGSAPKFLRTLIENIEDTVGVGRGKSRLYATVDLGSTRVGRTRVVENQPEHVVWDESFRIYAAHTVSDVIITVKDDNTVGASLIGRAKVPVSLILAGGRIDDWYGLMKDNGEPVKHGEARVRFCMEFFPADRDPQFGNGIGSPNYGGVPYTFFPQRTGCHVTLYQDSHMADNFLPPIYLDDGKQAQPTRCWEDVYEAITNAEHLIYITGWSVYTEIKLIRDEERMIPGAEGVTLGELLKKKADAGVRVNLLVWDDRTSIAFLNKDGLMATHDEDTHSYFEGSNVNCILCPRNPDSALSIIQGFQIGAMFTHHQKTLIVDAPVPGESDRRRILSFVGGIDLCDGRYDTQYHPIFRSLNGVNHDDFHQPNFAGAAIEKGGPREPWHDIHSRVEGIVAWDVLFNFERRWNKQAGDNKKDLIIPIKDLQDMSAPEPITDVNDPESWNVQLFRSIDAGAVDFETVTPEDCARAGLVSGKDNVIDRSIQDAYINAIRRAKDFIYIENQYFLGSCFGWDDKRDAGALHLIPMELALKIVSKIEAHERFAVYIITPMWPEGVPESGSVQAILDWMHRTMSMMYKLIATALHSVGSDGSPRDYLNFFCLGNREAFQDGEFQAPSKPEPDTDYQLAQNARRFMIYVHSKMMIVDDEYIIVGSANINERSMNGGRDTEIAIGAWQPQHITQRGRLPRGIIHGFRMSLWFEHLGRLDNSFLHPESLQSVQLVNSIADELWTLYTQDEPVDLPGHLLPFPVAITQDGDVSPLPGIPNFPDTKAPVIGALQEALPSILTT